jgi:broad specificity phosphatase PhoE
VGRKMHVKIGLVRHFKVKKDLPKKILIAQDELLRWFEEYDYCDIEYGEVDLGGIEWKSCFSSDLSRAVRTAETIHNGDVVKMKELRELGAHQVFKSNIKLPMVLWALLIRGIWLLDHKSQVERRADIQRRIRAALDEILSKAEGDILIVSHGALMLFIRKELIKRGFKGPRLRTPENGKLYLYENE